MRVVLFTAALIILVAAFTLLITGSPLLTLAIGPDEKIPLGTPITALGMIALGLTVYWGTKAIRQPRSGFYRILKNMVLLSVLMAVLWVPVSYFLAGNLSFSFGEKATFRGGQLAMKLFWTYSYLVVLLPIVTVLAHWISSLPRKQNKVL